MKDDRHTLRYQVKHLVWVSIMAIFLILVIFIGCLVFSNQAQIDKGIQETAEIIQSEVVNYQKEVEKVASLVAYNGLILRISSTKDLSTMTRMANDIQDMLEILTSSNENISGIVLTNFEHLVFGIESSSYKTLYMVQNYVKEHPDEKLGHLSFYNEDTKQQEYLYYQRSVASSRGSQYYTIVVYQLDILKEFLQNVNSSEMYLIQDSSGAVLASNYEEELEGNPIEPEVKVHIDGLEWKILGKARKYYKSRQFLLFLEITALIFLGIASWMCIMAKLIIRNITDPIAIIADFVKSYSFDHKNRQRIELQKKNEILQIGNGVNEMLDDLENASENLVKAKEQIFRTNMEKQKSELIALQIQVNPHFLFNTLNCINGMAVSHEESEISTVVTAMASIMRYSLGEEKSVSLGQEMECVQNYCRIIKVRFQDRVCIEYDIDELTEHRIIPKMIVQPIVENAVSHGFEACSERGELWIRTEDRETEMVLTVENTGKVIQEEEERWLNEQLEHYVNSSSKDVIYARKHIGMRNVHARLKMLYGEQAGVQFRAREGGGAVVTLRIPYTGPEDEEGEAET